MNLTDAILTRRSVRQFTNAEILPSHVQAILKAGLAAPSARNTRCAEFVVVQNRATLNEMADALEYGKMLATAPLCICVCANSNVALSFEYGVIDTSAATQNILLQAHDLGLGAVWLGVYPRSHRVTALTKILNLPSHLNIISAVAIGHPQKQPKPVDKFDNAKIFYEKF